MAVNILKSLMGIPENCEENVLLTEMYVAVNEDVSENDLCFGENV